MKKLLASLFIFAFAFFGMNANKVYAKVITEKEGTVTVAKDEIVNDDLFIGAKSVLLDGTVNGDVFIGAESVKIGGVVNGNVHTAAKTIDVSGSVRGNMYGGGQTILVTGSHIGGSLLLGGATVSVDKDTTVAGSILTAAESVAIDSRITRNVFAGAGTLNIGASTQIGKDLYYGTGENKATISPDAVIVGATHKSEMKTPETKSTTDVVAMKKGFLKVMAATKVGMSILMFLGALIVGWVWMKLVEKQFSQSTAIVSQSFWKSMGLGFLIAMAFIPAVIILCMTFVGLPLAGMSVLVFILYSCLSGLVTARALGTALLKANKKTPVFAAFALGLVIIKVVEMIPFAGFFVTLAVFWTGLGALTMQLFAKQKTVKA